MQDNAHAWAYNLEAGHKTRIIGPNCPGIVSPGRRCEAAHGKMNQDSRA